MGANIKLVGDHGETLELDDVRSICVNDVWFAPVMIDKMGDHPERLMSIKRKDESLWVHIVRIMDEKETAQLWEGIEHGATSRTTENQ